MSFRLRNKHIDRHSAGNHQGYIQGVAHICRPKIEPRLYGEALPAMSTVAGIITYFFKTIAMFMLEKFPFMAGRTFLMKDTVKRISFFEQRHKMSLGAKVRRRRNTWVIYWDGLSL